MHKILFNDLGRLRSGWRFFLFLLLFFFLYAIISALAVAILQNLPIGFGVSSLIGRVFGSIIGLFLAILVGWFFGKIFEDLPYRALGAAFTKFWFKDLILGLIIGAGSIAFAVLLSVTFGNLRFQFNPAGSSAILTTLWVSAIVFLFAAALEEAIFRGYVLQTFARANLGWLAILLTSVFFASVHMGNPSASVFSSINTALAGIWLGIAYLKTRTLWLAFGLHFAWNWAMGAFFGIEVSGITNVTTAPLLQEIDAGPIWITGGDYGLEGGAACSIALIGSIILIWFLPVLKPTDEMLELTSTEKPLEQTT